jgi:ribosomal protein S24E
MKTEKEIKEDIIKNIIFLYSKIKINNTYENFGKHKTKTFTDFIQNIINNEKKIYNLTDNNFHTKIKNEINIVLINLKEEYKSNQFPSLLNFDIKLNELLKLDKNNIKIESQKEDIKKDNKKMLEKYYDKEYDLDKVDKFIKTLTKSIYITNENNITLNNDLIKDIIELNTKFKLHQNPEIQKLAIELEEHLKPKDKPENPKRNFKPDYQELS